MLATSSRVLSKDLVEAWDCGIEVVGFRMVRECSCQFAGCVQWFQRWLGASQVVL